MSASGLGLEDLGDISALLDEPENRGRALEIPLDLIDEDPDQPRTEFNPVTLGELAAMIRERGVKSPISVRSNPNTPGRFIINHGARRYRASMMAGRETIPGFIDEDYNNIDQAIENLHRDGLSPREIANVIHKELSNGMTKGQIAAALGKSNAFVKQHVTLLDLPEPIADVFNNGRCGDVTVINELVTAYKKNPEKVTEFLENQSQELTRGEVKKLRNYIENRPQKDIVRDPNTVDFVSGNTDSEEEHFSSGGTDSEEEQHGTEPDKESDKSGSKPKKDPKPEDPDKLKKGIVLVQHDGRAARILYDKRPTAEGLGWIKYEIDGEVEEVDFSLGKVQLVAVMEG
jgi:ParB family chromosome partitioning protein